MSEALQRMESRYRFLLNAYPREWRESARTLEILDTLLEAAAEEDRGRVRLGDAMDLLGHGFAARLKLAVGTVHARTRARIAQLGIGSAAGLSLALLVLAEIRWPAGTPGFAVLSVDGTLGPFMSSSSVCYAGFFLALGALLLGRVTTFRLVLALTMIAAALNPLVAWIFGVQRAPTIVLVTLLAFGFMSIQVPGPAIYREGWRTGAAAVAAVVALVVTAPGGRIVHNRTDQDRWYFYWFNDAHSYYRLSSLAQHVPIGVGAALLVAIALRHWIPEAVPAAYCCGLGWLMLAVPEFPVGPNIAIGLLVLIVAGAGLPIVLARLRLGRRRTVHRPPVPARSTYVVADIRPDPSSASER